MSDESRWLDPSSTPGGIAPAPPRLTQSPGPSGAWRPGAGRGPNAPRGSGAALRDSLIVAGVSALAVIGLIVWSGGDVGGGGEDASGAAASALPTIPTTLPLNATTTTTTVAAVAAPATAAAADAPADAAVMQAGLASFPAPAEGREEAASSPSERVFAVAAEDWSAVRNAYVLQLAGVGYLATTNADLTDAEGAVNGVSMDVTGGALPRAVVVEVLQSAPDAVSVVLRV